MKRIKFVSLFMCLILILSISSTAFASYVPPETSENVEMAIAGQTKASHDQAIVLIPGIGGSELYYNNSMVWVGATSVFNPSSMDYLRCNNSGTPEYTITVPAASTTSADAGARTYYENMYDALYDAYSDEYDVLFFPYDWRKSNTTNAANLAVAINNTYDSVILVAHSMGGLIASKYCANSSVNRGKVDKLITLGTPYTGSPQLVYVAETGDFNPFLNDNKIKSLVNNFPAVYQLIPTTRYADSYSSYIKVGSTNYSGDSARNYIASRPWAVANGATKPMFNSATTFHSGLLISGTHVANGGLVDTYKIVGSGVDTASKILYDANGNYTGVELNNSGDGTVPRYSASNTQSISSANQVYSFANVNHMNLASSASVINQVKSIIDGSASKASIETEAPLVNEKGWLVGEDNRRIYITMKYSENLIVTDQDGSALVADGNYLYDKNGNNVGSMWMVGNDDIMFCMKNGNYTVSSTNATKAFDDVKVVYQNNGYDEYIETYESVNAHQIQLEVSEYSNFDVQCKVGSIGMDNAFKDVVSLVPVVPTSVISATD